MGQKTRHAATFLPTEPSLKSKVPVHPLQSEAVHRLHSVMCVSSGLGQPQWVLMGRLPMSLVVTAMAKFGFFA